MGKIDPVPESNWSKIYLSSRESESERQRVDRCTCPGNCPPTHPLSQYFCPKWKVGVNGGLGEGKVGSIPETYNDPKEHTLSRGFPKKQKIYPPPPSSTYGHQEVPTKANLTNFGLLHRHSITRGVPWSCCFTRKFKRIKGEKGKEGRKAWGKPCYFRMKQLGILSVLLLPHG